MRMWTLCVVGVAVALSGCGGVVSDHPLSDEKTSEIDERLIGVWELVPKKEERAKGKPRPRLYVGKRKGFPRVLEVVFLDMDKEMHIEVHRLPIYTTTIGDARYMSLTGDDSRPHKEKPPYLLSRYSMDERGRLVLQALDEDKVAAAIRAKAIAGRVKEHDKKKKPGLFDFRAGKYAELRLTADTQALRAWIAKTPGVWEPAADDMDERGWFQKLPDLELGIDVKDKDD